MGSKVTFRVKLAFGQTIAERSEYTISTENLFPIDINN